VKAIRFFGSHQEIVVTLAENALTVNMPTDVNFSRGEKVYVVPAQPNAKR
jgi:hypothetical protein